MRPKLWRVQLRGRLYLRETTPTTSAEAERFRMERLDCFSSPSSPDLVHVG